MLVPAETKPCSLLNGNPVSWAVGAVRTRKSCKEKSDDTHTDANERRSYDKEEEDQLKQDKARDCSERQIFRKVFDGLQQVRSAACDKEQLAERTFQTALLSKVFDRLRGGREGSLNDQAKEIAFLRELGWAPEGEDDELDDSPLTAEEIAGFQQLHGARSPETGGASTTAQDCDTGSSCSSESDDHDSHVPLFF
eukprot:TRINITY_DN28078_c0_g1_i1.p1 TRINITY_DN28078_c0_g1~~TRINITY_DN28078_c0_g1_i1.p1  ORF type:complete len:195 (-),score=63.13 TRINITY_DN28078_c0_g1_i1:92-676(-)